MRLTYLPMLVLLAASAAVSCPNLAGDYQTDDEGISGYLIRQEGCESVTLIEKDNDLGIVSYSTMTLVTDGKPRSYVAKSNLEAVPLKVEAQFIGKALKVFTNKSGVRFYRLSDDDTESLVVGTSPAGGGRVYPRRK